MMIKPMINLKVESSAFKKEIDNSYESSLSWDSENEQGFMKLDRLGTIKEELKLLQKINRKESTYKTIESKDSNSIEDFNMSKLH